MCFVRPYGGSIFTVLRHINSPQTGRIVTLTWLLIGEVFYSIVFKLTGVWRIAVANPQHDLRTYASRQSCLSCALLQLIDEPQ